MWGAQLGGYVNSIRSGHSHKDKREDLIAIGFVFEKHSTGTKDILGWARLKPALEQYKKLHGHLRVPYLFVIPPGSPDWPEEMVGIKLGRTVYDVRSNVHSYREHRAEMREMGVEMKVHEKMGSEVTSSSELVIYDHQLITASGRPKHR